MGAALLLKPGLKTQLSLLTFGIAQIAMDIEPGIGMLTGAAVLHGPSHTFLGALAIAFLVMLIAPSLCNVWLKKWNKEVTHYRLAWLVQLQPVPQSAVVISALFGTLSHVVLDSLIHHDIAPLLPFSTANPFLGLVSHDGVYQLCAIAAVLGAIAWLALLWAGRGVNQSGKLG